MLSGLLIGFEGQDRQGLPRNLRARLERSLVEEVNKAADEARTGDPLGAHSIVLVLNYSFELFSEFERARLDYDVRSFAVSVLFLTLISLETFADTHWDGVFLRGRIHVRKLPDVNQHGRENPRWS